MNKPVNVLIANNEQSLVNNLRKLIENENINVELAETFSETLSKITNKNWDIILLDISFEDGNGMEILNQVSTMKKRPVVIITEYPSYSTAIQALRYRNVFDYLEKPVTLDSCRQTIKLASRKVKLKRNRYQKFLEVTNNLITTIEEIISSIIILSGELSRLRVNLENDLKEY